jgi:adenosylhomocysteine nucleosidase
MALVSTHSIAKREFFSGNLDGSPMVLVRSPMGKVNNAITTQLLISNYEIDRVISISPAGGIGDDVDIGDMVIADSLVQHDFGTIKPYGFVAGKAPDGLNWKKENYILSNGKISRGSVEKLRIHGLREVHIGTVVSGDQFIASPAKRVWLKSMHGADAADMGAAAIGQVCQANNVRLLVARIITDKAGITARTNFPAWDESYSSEFDMPGLARILLSINAQAENR